MTVKVDLHAELLGAYPWGWTTPSASANLADTAAYENGALVFTDKGTLPGADPHDYAALAASDRRPERARPARASAARSPARVCAADDSRLAAQRCDDGPYGKGAGGQLRYRVTSSGVTARRSGSPSPARTGRRGGAPRTRGALRDPGGQLAQKAASRARLAQHSLLDLPGDRQLQEAVDWGKQNIADLTQTATDLQIRFVDQGKQYPPPVTTLRAPRSSAPAIRTTRGCSPPTASTRRSPRSPWASSRPSRST